MVTKIKLYNPSASELVSDWHLLDARGKVLGRLASQTAMLLMGKHRPEYVPHMLSGDFVIITNAAEVVVTGNKAEQIVYKRHSQRPGKLKEIPYKRVQAKFPERIIEHAVRGMLPKNKLGERMIRRLKVYAGEEHPHVSQLTWAEHRPERDAVAAVKAEEEANKRAESRRLAIARREIADSASAKTTTPESEIAEPESKQSEAAAVANDSPERVEQPEQAAVAVETDAVAIDVTEDDAPAKKAPAKKPAAKRASTSKASGAASTRRKATTGTSSASSKPKASTAKSGTSASPKASPARKSPTTKKTDSK